MLLDVPLIQQKEGSYHCQVATLLMVMEYFGDHVEYDELVEELKPYFVEGGMHNQGPITYMRKRGYQTLFAHHDLGVLTPEIENITEKEVGALEKALEKTPADEKNKYRREKLALDIAYIKEGGKYSTNLPTLEVVNEYLEKEIPIVLGAIRDKGLHLNPTAGDGNHAVVITGREGEDYFINDPSSKSLGKYSLHKDRLLHAWYSSGVQTRIAWK